MNPVANWNLAKTPPGDTISPPNALPVDEGVEDAVAPAAAAPAAATAAASDIDAAELDIISTT